MHYFDLIDQLRKKKEIQKIVLYRFHLELGFEGIKRLYLINKNELAFIA